MTMQIIDADGHINDLACGDEIAAYMPKGNQMSRLFPEFDHLHFRYFKQSRRNTGNPSPDDWIKFSDKTGISWTVLYPTAGLASAESWQRNGRLRRAKPTTPGSTNDF
jgi:hypothetical protein